MQPPPRKVKPNIALKNTHADQVSKLQAKHQQECDLLEDIRTFFARKSALEKEYAQGLLKVTSQLLKREFPAQPDINTEDGLEHKTVCTVWRSILEETDRLAKTRLQAAEIYSEKAAEPLKPAKASKAHCLKKVLPQLGVIQAEVAQCVSDMVKAQKTYNTEGSVAHEARQKSSEAEDKLKRKSTGIFQSLSGLQKTCSKLRSRTEASEVKETSTRNEYLLSQAAANAHHLRYYSTDLPDLMKTLDCDVYERIQEALSVAGQTAAEIAEAESCSFQTIATEAAKICREFSHQCYLFQNPVFTNLVQYQFEPCHGDTCNKVSGDHGAGPDLDREARKWSTKVAKETRAVRDYYRQLTVLQNGKTLDKTSDSGSQEATPVDPETKQEELRQSIRKSETAKLKAEARLDVLRAGDVNVDDWINQAQMESLVADEKGLARTPSQVSLRTESSGGHSAADDHDPSYTHYDDDDDFIDDSFNNSGNRSGRTYPIFCKALYDFEASNYDEMTIKGNEDLELIADGDGEGWVKAKNSLGQEGYIPETYVDLGGLSAAPAPLGVAAMNAINDSSASTSTTTMGNGSAPTAVPAPLEIQPETDHFEENNDLHQESVPEQQTQSEVALTSPDLQSPSSNTASPYSSCDLEIQQTTTDATLTPQQSVAADEAEATWARALYDYEAQTDEELSFPEGALIRVLRKDDNGVDDGFWEGECQGQVGVFPSLVVEEIVDPSQPAQDPLSPGVMSLPPDFSGPPPVHVTLPTPDAEPPPPPTLANGEASPADCLPTLTIATVPEEQQQQQHDVVASSLQHSPSHASSHAHHPSQHHHIQHSLHQSQHEQLCKHSAENTIRALSAELHEKFPHKEVYSRVRSSTLKANSKLNKEHRRKQKYESFKREKSSNAVANKNSTNNNNGLEKQRQPQEDQSVKRDKHEQRKSAEQSSPVVAPANLSFMQSELHATLNQLNASLAGGASVRPVSGGDLRSPQRSSSTSSFPGFRASLSQTEPDTQRPTTILVDDTPTIVLPIATISLPSPVSPKLRPTTPPKPCPTSPLKPRSSTPTNRSSPVSPPHTPKFAPPTPTKSHPTVPAKPRLGTPSKHSKPRSVTPTIFCPTSPTITRPEPWLMSPPSLLPQSPFLSCPATPLQSLTSSMSSLYAASSNASTRASITSVTAASSSSISSTSTTTSMPVITVDTKSGNEADDGAFFTPPPSPPPSPPPELPPLLPGTDSPPLPPPPLDFALDVSEKHLKESSANSTQRDFSHKTHIGPHGTIDNETSIDVEASENSLDTSLDQSQGQDTPLLLRLGSINPDTFESDV